MTRMAHLGNALTTLVVSAPEPTDWQALYDNTVPDFINVFIYGMTGDMSMNPSDFEGCPGARRPENIFLEVWREHKSSYKVEDCAQSDLCNTTPNTKCET